MVQEEIGEKERTIVVGVLKRRRLMSERGEHGAGDVQDKENRKVTMSKMPHLSLTSEGKWYSPRILHRRNNSVSNLLRIIRPCVRR